MYTIHHMVRMKRTQLYLDEDVARVLAALSREQDTTISNLVRKSVRQTYLREKQVDRAALARQLSGIWADRAGIGSLNRQIRRLRKGIHRRRLTGGRDTPGL